MQSIKEWGRRYWRRWKESMLGSGESLAAIQRTLSPGSTHGEVEPRSEAVIRLQDEIDRIGPVATRAQLWLVAILGFGAGGAFVAGGAAFISTKPLLSLIPIVWGSLLAAWTGYGLTFERQKDRAGRILHEQLRAVTAGENAPSRGAKMFGTEGGH